MEATTVAAQGIAEAPFEHAGFNLSLSGMSTSPTNAKRLLADAIVELNQTLDGLKTTLSFDFVKNSLQTNSNVQPYHEWDGHKQVFRGYQVSYGMFFEISDLDLVSKVYDALTSLVSVGDDVRVSVGTPSFSITPRTRERLNKKALKKAWQNVEERFETECDVLALDPGAFEVATWETSYSDSRRSDRVSSRLGGTRAMAASAPAMSLGAIESASFADASGGGAPVIEIQVGQATVTVNLEVGFARRADAKTIKATVVSKGSRATSEAAGSQFSASSLTS